MEPPNKRPRPTTPEDEENRSPNPRRPLFHSPTKSSLAKHAPHLLRKSPARSNPRKQSPSKSESGVGGSRSRTNGVENGKERARGSGDRSRDERAQILQEDEDLIGGDEAVRAVVAKMKGLRQEIENLEEQVRRERERLERENHGGDDREEGEIPDPELDVEALMNSLLASNDSTLAAQIRAASDRRNALAAIPSARPVRLDDPLPSLRAFSAITYTRLETLALGRLDPTAGNDGDSEARDRSGIIREDRMSGYAGDRELFFRVRMRVDTRVHSVKELDAEVSAWARRELGPHLDTCIQSCNISAMLASLSSFTKQATARSKVFALLTRSRPDLLPPLPSSARPLPPINAPLTHAETLQHQGRTLLRLKPRTNQTSRDRRSAPHLKVPGGLELLLSWEIVLDALGEAKSKVRMAARWSDRWAGGEGKEVLDQIESMFDGLVARKGVLGAAKAVCSLLFPQAAG